MIQFRHTIDTPLGPMAIIASESAIVGLDFTPKHRVDARSNPLLAEAAMQIDAYFNGTLKQFKLPLSYSDQPEFERDVLDSLLNIPFGEVVTYKDIALAVGMPGATQAVGNAVGRNPVPLIIPCHRVIRSDGSLGGFSGPVGHKRKLLALEGIDMPEQLRMDV